MLGDVFGVRNPFFSELKVLLKLLQVTWRTHKNPTYGEVCNGNTGHTETIKVLYDHDIVSYGELLEIFFTHDPTTLDRQGNDVGSQYRSAVFFNNIEEKIQIEDCINRFQLDGIFDNPIVTEVNTECPFYPAETEHHEYYNQHKEQPYCQLIITPKSKNLNQFLNNIQDNSGR